MEVSHLKEKTRTVPLIYFSLNFCPVFGYLQRFAVQVSKHIVDH